MHLDCILVCGIYERDISLHADCIIQPKIYLYMMLVLTHWLIAYHCCFREKVRKRATEMENGNEKLKSLTCCIECVDSKFQLHCYCFRAEQSIVNSFTHWIWLLFYGCYFQLYQILSKTRKTSQKIIDLTMR